MTNIHTISPIPAPQPSSTNDRGNQGTKVGMPGAGRRAFPTADAESVVKELNRVMESLTNNLEFSVDRSTNQTVIRVVNTNTKEVVRQIPSDEMLRVARRIADLLGVLYDHEG